ncbi:MAG: hypothetical protein OEZ34_04230 [Spirochaetia bacterium]|nr:hypothetical protein [Spirochaetia bacterium]
MSEKLKYTDERQSIWSFEIPTVDDPILLVCPECSEMARAYPPESCEHRVKVVCPACSYVKNGWCVERQGLSHFHEEGDFFGYKLWLRIPCAGHTLWVVNRRHLEMLESFVAAELRERNKNAMGYSNTSLFSRLPKWIKSSKKREKLLLCLKKLRLKIVCKFK